MTLYLIATIAGQRVALPAEDIESVVEIEFVTPVPRAPAHVLGLSALRSRVLTVIDSHASLGIGAIAETVLRPAVVAVVDGHFYALVVDAIEDATTLDATSQAAGVALGAGWARVARGTLDHDGGVLLIVDTASLIAGPAQQAAA